MVLDQTFKKGRIEVSGSQRFLEVLGHDTGAAALGKEIFQKIFRIIMLTFFLGATFPTFKFIDFNRYSCVFHTKSV